MGDQFRERGAQWVPALNALGVIAEELYALSTKVTGKAADPQQIAARLFRRLFSNGNAFNILIQNGCDLEAQMVLRHALEVAICLAKLSTNEDEFVRNLLSDTAWTVIGQLPYWYDEADQPARKQAVLDQFGQKNSVGKSHQGLQWNDMARTSGVSHLYAFYKNLSGTAAHVSGLSLMLGMANTGLEGLRQKADGSKAINSSSPWG